MDIIERFSFAYGAIFILHKGGPENGNYVIKMSVRRGWLVLKSLKTPLRYIKMVPNCRNKKNRFI